MVVPLFNKLHSRDFEVLNDAPSILAQHYPSKRQRLADDANSSWLKEVQSKIWKNERLAPELFQTVEVTKAHYTELQRRLKEQHPGRDLPEYDGRGHNVRDVKLDFLRSITSSSPQHFDNNENRVGHDGHPEASNEDVFEINTYFPFTLRFLDLSTLNLKEQVPDRLPLPLFLRQDYDDISALIKKEPRSKQGSVMVSGQPGTGQVLVSLSTGSNQLVDIKVRPRISTFG